MKIVTCFPTLMLKAYKLGQARLSGNKEVIAIAEQEHDAYRDTCLRSDEMLLGIDIKTLSTSRRK